MKKNCLLFLALFGLALTKANAQIVYTDIPDGVPTGIDFDTDGTDEFTVTDGMGTGDYVAYWGGGPDNNIHAVGTLGTQGWDVPNCVDSGFTVDASGQWEGQGDCSIIAWGAGNPTITTGADEYLAVRFNLGANLHYGWIRIEVDGSENVIYKDYAYNATPNTPINAGDTGAVTTSVQTFAESGNKYQLFPNPATSNSVTVGANHLSEIKNVQLFSVTGELVIRTSATSTLDLNHVLPGLYFVVITDRNGAVYQEKLLVQ